MQDKGENITKYVSGYVIKNHNISLYDNPGIETYIQPIKIFNNKYIFTVTSLFFDNICYFFFY